jgi:cellulose synthase/poly-beta-1,6-N-acetylglucosamine synthase-like glycosyltransferase
MAYGKGPVPAQGAKGAPVATHGRHYDRPQVVHSSAVQPHAGRAAQRRSAFPEIDCVRDRLPLNVIAAVERRAIETGVSADRVLVAAGIIDEDRYLHALSRWLGLAYETFADRRRESCPLDDQQLMEAAKTGLLPLIIDGELVFIVAPRSVAQLVDQAAAHPHLQFRLTSTARLNRFIGRHSRDALGYQAAEALKHVWPDLSAASRNWRPLISLAAIAALALGSLIVLPELTLIAIETTLAGGFLAWLALRWFGSYVTVRRPRPRRISDDRLPVYTIIVALYHEAHSVEVLIRALRKLDYPPEKLQIILATEPDDTETIAALARLELDAPFEIITAPENGPRTKPKALNAALAFARGTLTVVYDAEDRPEPDQLRRAIEMFLIEKKDVACVQARLTIDNTSDSWLASIFTAEYAAQFDLFLPGLAALRLPVPLGGSSNHFPTAVLRQIGAWDSYNVTEDADLGMRLARFGYRSAMIHSTTYEEAPARFGAWLRQRTRWFKGWMQTWAVHMRDPRRLLRELGLAGFLTFQLVVGGNVLAALIHPLVLVSLAYALVAGIPILPTGASADSMLKWIFWITLAAGYLTTILLGLRGLAHRGLLSAAWALAFVWVHWLLLSLAAWRALYQLVRNPHGWEKTEHGLARTSRLAKMSSTATLDAVFRDGFARQEPPLQTAAE